MSEALSKFTTHYRGALALAYALARTQGSSTVEPHHLLRALSSERGALATEILEKHGLSREKISEKLAVSTIETDAVTSRELSDIIQHHLSPTTTHLVERSVLTAWRYQHHYVGTEHLLYAMVSSDDEDVISLWSKLEVEPRIIKTNVVAVLKSTSKFPDLTEAFTVAEDSPNRESDSPTQALDFFCTDLTGHDTQNKLDPVIGRDQEISRLISILGRRTKNNPLLLGDPGVGKTAIVEGLARRIHESRVPEFLQDKRILALDLGLVVAGTMYRGEFESRLKQILDELKANPNIILFIDEVHTIVGTGAAPGSLDLANLLKPALAKGLIRCIGATTQEEYKKSIEPDPALERRFQVVEVKEPTPAEALEVLKGLRSRYETFHQVRITDEALEAAVHLSERHITAKFLPDKAIDLIDEAAARIRVNSSGGENVRTLRTLTERLKQLNSAKELAIKDENFNLANEHKAAAEKVKQELDVLQNAKAKKISEPRGTVGRSEVATVVAQATGIPATELVVSERAKLGELEQRTKTHVVGQAEAIALVTKAVKRGRLGLSHPQRPLGSFLFLGPSGVGKTELAKVLAREVFGSSSALIRLDMSEFAEPFTVSKLIGAPAGYVGYRDGTKLSDVVRRRPSSVVLFDEVEKAHPDVFNLLLQVLDEGHLTDASGKAVNFAQTIIILTSNLGLRELTQTAKLGFESESGKADERRKQDIERSKTQIMAEVKRFFRPEFLNRLDGTVVFNPLSEQDLAAIVELQVRELNKRFASEHVGISLKLARGTARAIARQTFSPQEGARGIRRFLQAEVEDALTDRLVEGKLKPGATVTLAMKDGKATLK